SSVLTLSSQRMKPSGFRFSRWMVTVSSFRAMMPSSFVLWDLGVNSPKRTSEKLCPPRMRDIRSRMVNTPQPAAFSSASSVLTAVSTPCPAAPPTNRLYMLYLLLYLYMDEFSLCSKRNLLIDYTHPRDVLHRMDHV